MILGKDSPGLTARQMQAVFDSFKYGDWAKRDRYARLDAIEERLRIHRGCPGARDAAKIAAAHWR